MLINQIKIYKKLRSDSGFTLMEIMVSIAILGIMTTIVILNLNTKNPKNALNHGTELLISSYRQVQISTLTGIKASDKNIDYGFYLVSGSNQLVMFADFNRDRVYDAGEAVRLGCQPCGTVVLPDNIEVFDLEIGTGGSQADLTIVFYATNTDDVYLDGILAIEDVTITLRNTRTAETDTATIYKNTGQISR